MDLGSATGIRLVQCNYCELWVPADDDSLSIHVLLSHPHSEESEIGLALKYPPRVPRQI
jgi:hypothetical protein